MMAITTHILDTARGKPASGMPVALDYLVSGRSWRRIGKGATDADGRVATLFPSGMRLQEGTYRLTFDTAAYFGSQNMMSFHPEVSVIFDVRDASQHYHIPLVADAIRIYTYRGS